MLLAFYHLIAPVAKHPGLNITLGFGMLAVGVSEFLEQAIPGLETQLELHHGMVLIGLVTLLNGLVAWLERMEIGMQRISDRNQRGR